ncbi:MAG: 2Fe-2S iron-sulfur cluster binding domain-containing protein [Proteobacteria bacterium]|nr:2Fe-2S iron-sulfur cluster binding domain-containing protein [Pseudomonadota bacterium]
MHYPAAMPVVRFPSRGLEIEVPPGTPLIEAIRGAGVPVASSCGDELLCAKCGVRILAGSVPREKPVERRAKRRNRVPDELRLSCALRVRSDLSVGADYWPSGA